MSEPCTQEQRLIHLEAALAGISDTLKDVKDLLKSSIKADERIRALQTEFSDQEKRLRNLELSHAAVRWIERVIWAGGAAILGFYINKG